MIGPHENDGIAKESPFRTCPLARLNDVKEITLDRVDLCSNDRLRHALGGMPPEEGERN